MANESNQLALRYAALLGALLSVLLTGAYSYAQKPANEECLACHGDATLTKDVNGQAVSISVDPERFKNSAHGGMFSCVDCHTDVKSAPHANTPAKISCATCHAEEQAAYAKSFHAKTNAAGAHLAGCVDCHGSPHELLPSTDPKARTSHANIPVTCGGCHNQKLVMEAGGGSTQPFTAYQASVHGRAVANGVEKAAVCTDCHGVHDIQSAGDPTSSIFKFNVPATCGKCHAPVEQAFRQSIHGQAIARGEWQAPVCTDCHGIHSIKAHNDPESSVSSQNLAQNTCAHCHEGVRLSEEFGFEGSRVSTYLASYHGLASRRGSTIVANCASCHGSHNILPSSDPRSSIHPANLVKTCGQCHQGATSRFVAAKVHVNAPLSADTGSVLVRWVRSIYLTLIISTIGAMFAHNFILWRFKTIQLRNRFSRTVTRMDGGQRFQHNVLILSFTVLVITGFALRFPDSWFQYLALGISERMRGIVHRVAGSVLIGAGLYHLGYAAFTAKGRRMIREFLPGIGDLRDFVWNLGYHLGLSSTKPVFGRFTYAEKVEYWALIWGTIVMAVTGTMLWAPVTVGNHFPRWWLDVATAIHFYEAVLATLAILVWHFYQVFFDPDAYPMNWAWWDGQMPLEHYRQEHALDVELLLEAGSEEARAASQAAKEEILDGDPGPDNEETAGKQ